MFAHSRAKKTNASCSSSATQASRASSVAVQVHDVSAFSKGLTPLLRMSNVNGHCSFRMCYVLRAITKVHSFKLTNESTQELPFFSCMVKERQENKASNDANHSFTARIAFGSLTCDADIAYSALKGNKQMFSSLSDSAVSSIDNKSANIPMRDRQNVRVSIKDQGIVGIPVGVILKHAWLSRSSHPDVSQNVVNPELKQQRSQLQDKLWQIAKKASSIDLAEANLTSSSIFAMCDISRGFQLDNWNMMMMNQLESRSDVSTNMTSFCRSLLLFDAAAFVTDFKVAGHGDKLQTGPHVAFIRRFLSEISMNGRLANRLLMHYLRATERNSHLVPAENCESVLTFDDPKLVPDILQLLHDTDADGCGEYWLKVKHDIVKYQLNSRQTVELETRFPAATFQNLMQIPDTYPLYSLRNMYLRSWKQRSQVYDLTSDKSHLTNFNHVPYFVNDKYKHSRNRRGEGRMIHEEDARSKFRRYHSRDDKSKYIEFKGDVNEDKLTADHAAEVPESEWQDPDEVVYLDDYDLQEHQADKEHTVATFEDAVDNSMIDISKPKVSNSASSSSSTSSSICATVPPLLGSLYFPTLELKAGSPSLKPTLPPQGQWATKPFMVVENEYAIVSPSDKNSSDHRLSSSETALECKKKEQEESSHSVVNWLKKWL